MDDLETGVGDLFGRGNRLQILVEADQARVIGQVRQNQAAMAAAAKRAIDVNAVRTLARQVEGIDRFIEQHRAMLKFRHRELCHYGALERKIGKYIGGAGIDRLLFFVGQFGGIPYFKVAAHADHHDFARQPDGVAQFGRDQHAAGRSTRRRAVAGKNALSGAADMGQAAICVCGVSHTGGEKTSTAIGVLSGSNGLRSDRQRVTVAGIDILLGID